MNQSEVRGRRSEVRKKRSPTLPLSLSPLLAAVCCSVVICWLIPHPANADEAQRQTVLFLADEGPLVIAFQITVEEKPFTEVWRTGLAKLVKEWDRDENGSLSREETEIDPQDKTGKTPKPSPAARDLLQVANLWDADAEPRDDQLSLEEICRFLSISEQGPFQTAASKTTAALQSPQLILTNNAGERLWGWLDENQDKNLSVEELRSADVTLKKYDLDADETISLNEVQATTNPFFNTRQSNQKTDTPFFAIHKNQSTTPLIRRLMQQYANKNQLPPSKEPGKKEAKKEPTSLKLEGVLVDLWKLPQEQRDRFDRDGNGVLDHWELRTYLRNPVPMVTIQIEWPASETAEPKLSGAVTDESLPAVVKESAGGMVSILAGEIQIEIDVTGLRPETLLPSLEERFKQVDRDNNGYLEQREVNIDQFFRQNFKKYDANNDDKLYPEEWKPPVIAAIQTAQTRTRLEVQNRGKDVFSVLDRDRNLQISPREWLTAAERLSVWDKNENRTLEQSEIPHVYLVSFGRGLPDLPGLITPQNNNQTPAMQRLVRGPKWFQAMDKNGDGDVSAREFLGKPDIFDQIDQNKDRLIDPREATKFSK